MTLRAARYPCYRWLAALGLALGLAVCAAPRGAAADPAACSIDTPERVVAVADVHGAYDRLVAILRAAGIVDGRQRWAGGKAVLVQTGDVLDRGPDSRRALDLLRRLEGEASRAGGRVHALLGNHEVMRMIGDVRYVSTGEYSAFRSIESAELRERYYAALAEQASTRAQAGGGSFNQSVFRASFLERTPLGAVEMMLAFAPKGEYGRWLRERDAMVKVNGVVFVHGGISPPVAALGCAAVNATVRSEVNSSPESLAVQPAPGPLSTREDGPLWYRGLALEDESGFSTELEAILRGLEARAIVVGHTVAANGRLTMRFNGRLVQLDTGMLGGSFYPSGRASALEIRNGQFTAIYESGREALTAPATTK